MSAADDERRRLANTYRELAASELLALFEKRETLSSTAVDCLRVELRLRGLDPDSLRATVPKATLAEDDGPAGHASLVDADMPIDEPSKAGRPPTSEGENDLDADAEAEPEPVQPPQEDASPAEAVASAAAIRCAHCGARNPAIEDLCLRCGQPLGESPAGQTMSRRIAEAPSSKNATGTVGSATTGVIGISALVFASYSLTLERPVLVVSLAAAAAGLIAVIAAVVLHRAEKRRRASEAATPN